MRIKVYIDGFNLYYGALRSNRGTQWLNIEKLSEELFPEDEVVGVEYFTAPIKGGHTPAENASQNRQSVYLRALSTLDKVNIQTRQG